MWTLFLRDWNGVAFFANPSLPYPLQTDAAGTIGIGAFFGGSWFALKWEALGLGPLLQPATAGDSMALRELIPVVLAVACWIEKFKNSSVFVDCDNQSVVGCIRKMCSPVPTIALLLRSLSLLLLRNNVDLHVQYIATDVNCRADALSRFQFERFQKLVPWADKAPSDISTIAPGLLQPICAMLKQNEKNPKTNAREKNVNISASVSSFLDQSLAPSTLRQYNSLWARFLKFCHANSLTPLPTSTDTLAAFLSSVAREGAPAAAKPIIASVRFHHIKLLGRAPSYDQTVIQQLTKGIANAALLNAAPRLRRVALSPSDVLAILEVLPRIVRDHYEFQLYRAAFLLAFGGFLRVSEYTAASSVFEGDRCLKLSKLGITPSAVTISLRRTKTSVAPVSVTVQANTGAPKHLLRQSLLLCRPTQAPSARLQPSTATW